MFNLHSHFILPIKVFKRRYLLTLTYIIKTLIIVYFFCLESSFCASASVVDGNNIHHNSFCDIKPNCDGDSELYERLLKEEDDASFGGNKNSLYHYPVTRRKRSFAPYRTGKTVAGQVSQTLDNLLLHSDYDKRIRPQVLISF